MLNSRQKKAKREKKAKGKAKGWSQNCKNKRLHEKEKARLMFAFLFT